MAAAPMRRAGPQFIAFEDSLTEPTAPLSALDELRSDWLGRQRLAAYVGPQHRLLPLCLGDG
jgi:hypothetical protein